MKIKIKKVKVKKWHIIATAFMAGVIVIGFNGEIPAYEAEAVYITATVEKQTPEYEVIAKAVTDSPIKQYAVEKALENKLDPLELIAVLQEESGFNENAYNINTNGTVDLGIAQWNSIHIKSGFITIECAGNAKCSINKMIEKRIKDGNYSAWYAARKLGIK
jgi:hypothetical protein